MSSSERMIINSPQSGRIQKYDELRIQVHKRMSSSERMVINSPQSGGVQQYTKLNSTSS